MDNPSGPPAKTTWDISSLAGLLAGLAPHVQDRYYKNQTVVLDGYTFTNCCFHNCVLVTETGTFSLKSCAVWNCQIRYGPNAVRIIRLWCAYVPNTTWPEFNPTVELDGSITIA